MPQQQQPLLKLFFILLVLWLMFPDGEYPNQSLLLSDLATSRLERYNEALDELNRTHWGDFAPQGADGSEGTGFVNLTGFREADGFAWEDLDRFRDRGLQLSRYAVPPVHDQALWDTASGRAVWANASGTLRGEWVFRPGSVGRSYDNYNLSHSVPSMNWIGDQVEWARNITGSSGSIVLRLDENRTLETYEQLPLSEVPLSGGSIRSTRALITIEDTTGSGLSWEMGLYGVHWPRQGVILLTTTSEKYEGIFGLPHLSPSADFFQSSQKLLNESLASSIARKRKNIYTDQRMPWSSNIDNPLWNPFPSPHCEYVVYAQVKPPTDQELGDGVHQLRPEAQADIMHAIESELDNPLGAPIPRIPELQMSALAWSPDCAFFLESKGPPDFSPAEGNHLTGLKSEVHIHLIRSWVLGYAFIMFAQTFLLKSQMRESSTPSTLGRVSFGTASIMLIGDIMTFVASAGWTTSAAATFLPTLTLLFSSFLCMSMGTSFLAKIHEVQIPESRTRRARDRSTHRPGVSGTMSRITSAPSTPNPGTASDSSILPAPVTANTPTPAPSQPVIVPSDQDVDAEIAEAAVAVPVNTTAAVRGAAIQSAPQPFQSILMRFFVLILCVGFLGVSSLTWYSTLRSTYMNACAFCYLSFWAPQIYRNTMRNCRRALTWQFVIGQSTLRLLPIAYFWTKADNFFFARPDWRAFALLAAWLWIQILILAAQDVVGPRFGIPDSWTPEAWDYHPVLREDNIEAGGLPIGLVSDDNLGLGRTHAGEERDKTRTTPYAIDCAICRETLQVAVVRAGEEDTSVAGAFARRTYMVTPCRHIFHTTCLESWMRFRLQCPICREELPPL